MNRICRVLIFSFLMMLLAAPALAKDPAGKYLVVIDPGHGGSDKGVKLSGDVYEKDVNLSIANMLKSDLEKAGFAAKLTRTGDDAPLADRIKMAAEQSTDVFIGIHINAGFGREAVGYELYFPGFNALPNARNDSGEIVKDMMKTRNLNESVRLARIVQKNLETVLPRKDRGLREAPIRIQASIPALVIELGFASNPDEKKQITSKETQKKLSTALAASVREFATTGKKNAP